MNSGRCKMKNAGRLASDSISLAESYGLASLIPLRGGFMPTNAVRVAHLYCCLLLLPKQVWQGRKQQYPALRGIHWIGGELGIRTPGTFHSSTVFKTAAIDH